LPTIGTDVDGRLPALLHLCDSLFPTGGYAHSDGLEAAAASGEIGDASGVRTWVDTLVDNTLTRGDGPAASLAWEGFLESRWPALRELDDEVYALRPSSTAREASRGVGSRLLRTWQRLHPHPGLDTVLAPPYFEDGWTLPVAFAAACAAIDIDRRTMLESLMYTRVAAAASAAMRLLPLGQLEAHTLVAAATARIPSACDRVLRRREPPGAFAPLVEVAGMQQQYVGSRLFRS
jgi:urease accessory protein